MVLGESPGWNEDLAGRPFVGESGKLLDKLFADVGIDMDDCFVANTTCCRSIGPPARKHIIACLDNLRAQVNLADPEWVLTLGNTALLTSGCTDKISLVQGHAFNVFNGVMHGRQVFATVHPAAGLRDPKRLTDLRSDLATFAAILGGDQTLQQQLTIKLSHRGKAVFNQ